MIIVTGGAGMIGSAFVWKCNQEGLDDIWIVDHLAESEKWKNLVGLRYTEYYHKDAFLEIVLESRLPNNVKAIIHLGACSATTEKDGDYLMENNYRYTRILAQWAIEHGIPFIYASSAATYGDGNLGFRDDHTQLHSLQPLNRYGYSKHFFDLCALKEQWLDSITGLKFFNVFGPNEAHKGDMRSVMCKAYTQILETGTLKLFKSYKPNYTDGGQMRDFIYVKDCVNVMWWLLQHPKVTGIYNIGTGIARDWNAVGKALFAAMGKPAHIDYIDMPESLQKQYQYFTEADMTKLAAQGAPLNWMTLEESVEDYVKTYLMTGALLSQENKA